MAESELYNLTPFKKFVFWPLAIVPTILCIFVGALIYIVIGGQHFTETQHELTGIASRTANFIPIEIHERIGEAGDMKGEDYELIELYLQSVMAGNDKIDDIYTLRPTESDDTMVFVVSGGQTEDSNGDGVIEAGEQKALLGERYNVSNLPGVTAAWLGPAVDQDITYDQGRAFLSGYAPLRDEAGGVVGILGVDFTADTISQERHLLLNRVLAGEAIIIPLIILMAWFLSRQVVKPAKVLISALDRIRHGEYQYEMPDEGRTEERVVSRLFNTSKEILMSAGVARQQEQLKAGEEDESKKD